MVDAHASGACGAIHGGSSPLFGTTVLGFSKKVVYFKLTFDSREVIVSTMNSLPVRNEGYLFDELLWIHVQGKLTKVRLVAESMASAQIQNMEGTALFTGDLHFEKSHDKGSPTRILYFVGGDQKVVVQESHLQVA